MEECYTKEEREGQGQLVLKTRFEALPKEDRPGCSEKEEDTCSPKKDIVEIPKL